MDKVRDYEVDLYEYSLDYEDRQHFAYKVEQKWISEVEQGIFHRDEVVITEENLDKLAEIGTLAKTNAKKQLEYMVITTIVLASRAAMRGGMDIYEAYILSDLYYQRVAECNTSEELIRIYLTVGNDFSDRVAEAKKKRIKNSYVEQAKEYIAKNEKNKITVEDIADYIGVHRSYLSRLFAKETGMTIKEYMIQEKLNRAANMLKYSNISIHDISDYLKFNSQSYFSEQFKKRYEITPLEYRKQNQVKDFGKE